MGTAQINVRQAAMLLITSLTSTGHLLFVRIVGHYAGRDSWISLVLAVLMGGAGLALVVRLLRHYPGQNLVQISRTVLGPVLGLPVSLLFLGYLALVNAILLRSFGDFMRLSLAQTPIMVLVAVVLLLAAYTCRQGIEVLARANDVILPLLILTGLSVSLIVTKDKQAANLLPILEQGWPPVLTGAIALEGLFAEAGVLGVLGGVVAYQGRSFTRVLWSMAVLGVMFIGPITGPTALFGMDNVRAMFYPTWEEVRAVEVAEFTAHLDVMGILLWTLGSFVKASVLLWATTSGLASVLRLSDYRPLIAPLAVATGGLALLIGSSAGEMMAFLMGSYPLFSITFGVGLPGLVCLVAEGKRRFS